MLWVPPSSWHRAPGPTSPARWFLSTEASAHCLVEDGPGGPHSLGRSRHGKPLSNRRRASDTLVTVQELRRWCSFEEVAYLLWHGELPTRDQLTAQNRIEHAQRALGPVITTAIADQPHTADPMDT